jgi:hypothetical protein
LFFDFALIPGFLSRTKKLPTSGFDSRTFHIKVYRFFELALSFGFLSKSKKSLMSGFGSKTYFHIKIQNIVTTPPTNVMDEMEYNVSLDSILKNGETREELL